MLEKELIKKCRLKDKKAFGMLMENYRKQVFSYLLRFCRNRMSAEDLFQETLIKVWKGFNSYDERNKFSSWLFSIAHNVATDSVRSLKIRNRISSLEDSKEFSNRDNPHKDLVEKEMYELVMNAVDELSESQREVFLLRQHSEMTFKEIADELKQPLNTVLSHMHYAVTRIRKKLRKEYG